MGFCQLTFVSGQSTLHVLHHRLLFPILVTTLVMIVNEFFLAVKQKENDSNSVF